MSNNLLEIGTPCANWNAAGTRILKYTVEMFHKGLNEHKVISAPDGDILQNKAHQQAQKWSSIWDRIESKRETAEMKAASLDEANSLTSDAEKAIQEVENLLIHTLSINDAIDWETLKQKDRFPELPPSKPKQCPKHEYPSEPIKETPQFTIFEKIFKSKRMKKIEEIDWRFSNLLKKWKTEKSKVDETNVALDSDYNKRTEHWKLQLQKWEERKKVFLSEQDKFNQKINEMKVDYLKLSPDSIVEYCEMVLNNSKYPDFFSKTFELEYAAEQRILIIEYQLPPQGDFPTIKEVKYIASRDELKETPISEKQQEKLFDDAMYKITLRTIHEIFEADTANAIDAVSFNGWIKEINKATGKEENNCILSIQVKKDEFILIDLGNVDPKTCFKKLKGVASSKLSSLTPIQPILQISKTDKRFVEGYDVVNNIDTATNLAAMDWEDFEHLIREIFEKEFKSNGGEVKITQASRDGGVDAVAFDPDPIRGGKIVIQAKRYTNTVGVSAVRDLYGTTMNEGATKGILVSTADYGPDAYDFAKGKPLTLLNGSNLLHLLEKHGFHAKIDLREARRILSEKDK